MRIQLFGNFCLFVDDQPLHALSEPRLQSLLAYLLIRRATPQPRHHLAFLLWPDTNEKQAQTNLRNLLHLLRKALPEPDRLLDITTQSVQWRAGATYHLDVAEFEEAIGQSSPSQNSATRVAALRRAIDLYRGDLLATLYDEWIVDERAHFRRIYIAALEELTHLLAENREFTQAIQVGQRLLQTDPLREESYRLMMQLYAANQERASALHLYHTCVRLLEQELDSEPSPLTQALYTELLHPAANEALPVSPTSPETSPETSTGISPARAGLAAVQPAFVGRRRERQRLAEAWSRTANGEAHLILLRGEAGIGKTRLAEEFMASIGRAGNPTARARAYMTTGTLAYAPLLEWLQAAPLATALRRLDPIWLSELARLLPELLVEQPQLPPPQPLSDAWQRQRLFEAIAHALLATGRPLLLFFDDLQWAEQEMLDYLHYLLMRAAPTPLLIVAAAQSDALDEAHPIYRWQAILARHNRLSEVELGLLTLDEVAELSAALSTQRADEALLQQLYQETAGHPLFVIETLRARHWLEAVQQESRSGEKTGERSGETNSREIEDATLPAAVRAVIQTRLAQLSVETRDLLAIAAVAGRQFTVELLMGAGHLQESTVIRQLDELWRRRLIREDGAAAYDFVHGKVREVAYAALGTVQRKQLHRHVAETLVQIHGANVAPLSGELAFHFEHGGVPIQALRNYQLAAEVEESLYANGEAIRHYRDAIRLWPIAYPPGALTPQEGPSRLVHLHERVGDLLAIGGEIQATRVAYRRAIELVAAGEVVKWATLLSKLGHAWERDFHYDEALACYTQAEALLQELPTRDEAWWRSWLQVQLERMWTYYWTNRYPAAEALAEQIALAVERAAPPSQRVSFYMARFSNSCRRHRYANLLEAVAFCRRALEISLAHGDAGLNAWARFGLGFSLLWQGQLDEAEKQLLLALEIAEQRGDLVHQARCLTYLTVLHRRRVELSETELFAQRSMNAAAHGNLPEYVATAHANLAWVAWQQHELEPCEEQALSALRVWATLPKDFGSCAFQWLALIPLLALRLGRHDVTGAVACGRALLEPEQLQLPPLLEARLSHAVSAWEANRAVEAKSHLGVSLELARRFAFL